MSYLWPWYSCPCLLCVSMRRFKFGIGLFDMDASVLEALNESTPEDGSPTIDTYFVSSDSGVDDE